MSDSDCVGQEVGTGHHSECAGIEHLERRNVETYNVSLLLGRRVRGLVSADDAKHIIDTATPLLVDSPLEYDGQTELSPPRILREIVDPLPASARIRWC